MNKNKSNFFVSCPSGLEGLLYSELEKLKITILRKTRGGAQFESTDEEAINVILHSRIASRVFRSVVKIIFKNEKDIYELAKKENWPQIFSLKQTFKINTLFDFGSKHFFKNSLIISQILKDGIVDRFREEFGERPNVNTENPNVSLLFRIERSRDTFYGTVLLDLCGPPMSNRGYRKNHHQAPLRENLAAGIVLSLDFDKNQHIFIDSMCGSGTLLIEGVLAAYDIPPSFLRICDFVENSTRPWAFMFQKWFTKQDTLQKNISKNLNDYYKEIMQKLKTIPQNQFYGYDIDSKSLETARKNCNNAGLSSVISIDRADACTLLPPTDPPGIIICNPPYGERMGKDEKLDELYYLYGENLKKNFSGFIAYVFTAAPELRKKISLQTSKRITMFNGDIECRLLRYQLF